MVACISLITIIWNKLLPLQQFSCVNKEFPSVFYWPHRAPIKLFFLPSFYYNLEHLLYTMILYNIQSTNNASKWRYKSTRKLLRITLFKKFITKLDKKNWFQNFFSKIKKTLLENYFLIKQICYLITDLRASLWGPIRCPINCLWLIQSQWQQHCLGLLAIKGALGPKAWQSAPLHNLSNITLSSTVDRRLVDLLPGYSTGNRFSTNILWFLGLFRYKFFFIFNFANRKQRIIITL